MKKFTKVCLIIAAVCAGAGVLSCGAGAMLGASFSNVKELADAGELDVGNWHIGDGVYYNSENREEGAYDRDVVESFDAESIKNLELKFDAADVAFQSADDVREYQVTLNYGYKKYFSCEQNGDTLTVEYKRKMKLLHSGAKITITVPKTAEIDKIELKNGAGDVELAGNGVTVKNFILSAGAGDLQVQNWKVSELFSVSSGAGDVEITKSEFRDISIETGAGDFELTADVAGDIDITTGAGQADLSLKGKEEDFNYDLSTGVGEVQIGDASYGGIATSKKIENQNANKTITIDSGVGEVDISFWE